MSNHPKERREARRHKHEDRLRALDYYSKQSGDWALSPVEDGERTHLRAIIGKAQAAQIKYERRVPVQLRLDEVA